MKTLLLFSFFLVMWGGYKFTVQLDDLLVKTLYRPDQMVEVGVFCFVSLVLFLNVGKRITLRKSLLPKVLFEKYSIHILFFYLLALVSSINSYYPSYSLFRAGQYLIAIVLIGYMLEEFSDRNVIIKALYFFGVVNLCYVVSTYFFIPELVVGIEGRVAGGGVFRADNGWSFFFTGVFSFCYSLSLKNHFWKIVHFSIFLLSIIFLLLSKTRGLVYPTPFLLLFILYYYKGMSFRLFFAFCLALATVLLLNYIGVPIFDLFTQKDRFVHESRFDTWQVVMENVSMVPFFGFGFLGTPAFLLPIKESLVGTRILITADPHNYFLTAYTEFGVVGFFYSVVFIVLLSKLLLVKYRLFQFLPRDILLPGLFSIIIYGIISSFVTNLFISPISFNVLSIITCILLVNTVKPQSR